MLRTKIFTMQDTSEENLKKNKFEFKPHLSDGETKFYIYQFPVYKYAGKTVLYCELKTVLGESTVDIDVYRANGAVYAPFYNPSIKNENNIVEQIEQSIIGRTKKMGIAMKDREKKIDTRTTAERIAENSEEPTVEANDNE